MQLPERLSVARLNTPIEKLERISSDLGVSIWMKRDDQTGFEWSGNKIRKLEFLVNEALEKKSNVLVTCGGVQSNHCRATAALAAKLNLRCILFLRGEKPSGASANYLLDQLFGAEIFYLSSEQYYEGMQELFQLVDRQVRDQGGKAFFIPEGGSNGTGSLGYVAALREIEAQLITNPTQNLPRSFDAIFTAHGSGGTLAGLILGKLLAEKDSWLQQAKIYGVNVCYDKDRSFKLVRDLLWKAIQEKKLGLSFMTEDIQILDGYLGKGYALSTTEELQLLKQVAQREGVLLDPVYTLKAFRGMVEEIKIDRARFGDNILFLHTGGGFGNFRQDINWESVL